MIWEKLKFTRNKRKILHEKKEWYLRKLHFSLEGVWKIHTLSHWVKFIYTVCATVKLVRLYIRSWKTPASMTCLIHTDRTWIFIHKIYIHRTVHRTVHVILYQLQLSGGEGGGLQCCWTHRNWKWGDLNKYRKQITSFTDLASKVMWV